MAHFKEQILNFLINSFPQRIWPSGFEFCIAKKHMLKSTAAFGSCNKQVFVKVLEFFYVNDQHH